MKKIIILILFAMGAMFSTQAQGVPSCFTTPTKTMTACEITVVDATIDTLNLSLSGNTDVLVKVSARVTKATGTIAGTVRLYGSTYGTTSTWTAIGDTLTLSNAAINEHTWNLTGNDLGWKYLRILQSGGTTMTGTISAKAWGIKSY